ncbi:MAG: sulfite exporter TauE/SafE family protein [Deltaproteobacteria bacterium]|nr:sulfite exporter TauE/SafE family protein [Deltaproteobacteria bacterium]
MIEPATIAIVAGAALVAGAINAVAGGGSLITFPTLVALGLPDVTAAVTNTVAMCPGYLGATIAQRADLAGQGRRAATLLPMAALGGVGGALLLLATGQGSFKVIVPFLLVFASLLVAAQDKLRTWIVSRDHGARAEALAVVPIAFAAVYGGYFGAGMGVIVLAALGVVLADSLLRINAMKQTVSLVVNVSAAIVFVIWGPIDWQIAAVMMVGSLLGGASGGVLARHIPPVVLRWLIVVIGLAISAIYLARL